MAVNRRRFSQSVLTVAASAGTGLAVSPASAVEAALPFRISLAQWSLHRSFFGDALTMGREKFSQALDQAPDSVLRGELDPLDFAEIARRDFGIDAIEYVNTFYFGRARDEDYLNQLRQRADAAGVRSLLIMCDRLGSTGAADAEVRAQVVENHRPWLEAAARLGCLAIRVNAYGEGGPRDQARQVADSLHQLGELAAPLGLRVLVENHGGLSSDAGWLVQVIEAANHPQVGTLPDFGNFRLSPVGAAVEQHYDRYLGVAELMPYAGAVSAKSYDFDEAGDETRIDFPRMLQIVTDAGYSGYVGVEYEGRRLSEADGIIATKRLLERIRDTLPPPDAVSG